MIDGKVLRKNNMSDIDKEVIVTTDVDGTLVKRNPNGNMSITNPYDGITYKYDVHWEHVELLKQYHGRGFFNIVWSANGRKHAISVVEALGLDEFVHLRMTKPMKHLDDRRSPEYIVGSHVFIPKEGWSVE